MDERCEAAYLVGLVGGSGSDLALLTGGELGEVTVVVTLPAVEMAWSVGLGEDGRWWGDTHILW